MITAEASLEKGANIGTILLATPAGVNATASEVPLKAGVAAHVVVEHLSSETVLRAPARGKCTVSSPNIVLLTRTGSQPGEGHKLAAAPAAGARTLRTRSTLGRPALVKCEMEDDRRELPSFLSEI